MGLRWLLQALAVAIFAATFALGIGACDEEGDGDADADTDGDVDSDSDSDTDTDVDGDGDEDADEDGDGDADEDDDADADADADEDGPTCVCGLQDSEVAIQTSMIHTDTDYSTIAGASCDTTQTCEAGSPQLYLPTGITSTLFDSRECLNYPGADSFVYRLQALIRRHLVELYNAEHAESPALLAMGNAGGWGFDEQHDETVLCDSGYLAPPWAPADTGFLQQGWGTNNAYYRARMTVRDLVQVLERQVGGQSGSEEAWPDTFGSWLVVSAPTSGATRIVFEMCCTAQEYDESTRSVVTDGERLVDLVINGTRYTAADLDTEVDVLVTGYVGLQVGAAPEGARHYGFLGATFTELTRGDVGLTGRPTEALTEEDLIESWLDTDGSCLDGDDIATIGFEIGFASDEQATVDGLCSD